MNLDRAIRIAQKKPVDIDFVDTIEQKPPMLDDSEQDTSSGEGLDFDIDAAMDEAMQSDSSSEEDFCGRLTKPSLAAAKRPWKNASPLFDDDSHDDEQPSLQADEGLNVNGKRHAPSSPSPPAYHTRSAKRARRAVIGTCMQSPSALFGILN